MKLLDRKPEHAEADEERYALARAHDHGLVPTAKAARVSDFIKRAISEVESLLAGEHDESVRVSLQVRLAHLKEERDKL